MVHLVGFYYKNVTMHGPLNVKLLEFPLYYTMRVRVGLCILDAELK